MKKKRGRRLRVTVKRSFYAASTFSNENFQSDLRLERCVLLKKKDNAPMNQSMATFDGGGGMWTTKSAHRWSLAGPWLFFSAAPQTPTVGCGAGEGRGGAGVDSPTIASFICVCCIKEHRNGRNFSSSLGDGNEVTVPWIPMGVTKYCLIGRVPQHCTQTKNSVRNVKNTKKKESPVRPP